MNIFKQLVSSNYSPKDIAHFRFQGIGKTILYVFLLTLLSVIPAMYFLNSAIIDGVSAAKDMVNRDFPSFTIENGRLHSDMDEPVILKQNDFEFILDSTGELKTDDLIEYDNAILLLEKDFVFIADGQSQAFPYSMAENLTLSKDDVIDFVNELDTALMVILPIFSLVIYIFSSGMKFIEISILALFGLMIVNSTGRNQKYGQVWRMSAYSVTLPTIFFTIMSAIQTTVPLGFFIHWIVAYIVLYLALKEIPLPKKP